MKTKIIIVLIAMALLTGCAKSTIINQNFENEQIIHLRQMKDLPDISGYAFYLNKGDAIPLKMAIESDLLCLSNNQISIILKRRVYFRVEIPERSVQGNSTTLTEKEKQKLIRDMKIYISPDSNMWAPYTDLDAVGKLFGIKGGSFSIGMGIKKEEGLRIYLNAKTIKM